MDAHEDQKFCKRPNNENRCSRVNPLPPEVTGPRGGRWPPHRHRRREGTCTGSLRLLDPVLTVGTLCDWCWRAGGIG